MLSVYIKIHHRPPRCWSGSYWNLLTGFCPLTHRLLIFKFKRLSKRSGFRWGVPHRSGFQGVRSYPRWNGPLTGIFRSDLGCLEASKSSEKSQFFLSVVNLPWGMFRVQRSTKSDWKLETLLQQPHGLAVWLAGCCWQALLLRNGGFSWEASMCQNLAPTHRRVRHLDKGNRETVCKVQCEKFSGHWVSATCKTRVLPESLATGIQDLWISKSVQIGFKKDSTFKRFSETFKDSIRKTPSFTKPFVKKRRFSSDILSIRALKFVFSKRSVSFQGWTFEGSVVGCSWEAGPEASRCDIQVHQVLRATIKWRI